MPDQRKLVFYDECCKCSGVGWGGVGACVAAFGQRDAERCSQCLRNALSEPGRRKSKWTREDDDERKGVQRDENSNVDWMGTQRKVLLLERSAGQTFLTCLPKNDIDLSYQKHTDCKNVLFMDQHSIRLKFPPSHNSWFRGCEYCSIKLDILF